MKAFSIVARWLFTLCIIPLLIAGSIALAINSQWFYEYGFKKYGVSQTTGIASPELKQAAAGLISYFNSGKEPINVIVIKDGKPFSLFNQKEIIHLKDVKDLFWLDYRVLGLTLFYALLYAIVMLFWRRERRQLAKAALYGSGLTLLLIVLVGIGAFVNFDWLFLQFHLLSFTNNFWALDPNKDYLIMLFPGGFWFDVVVYILALVVGGAIIIGGTSWIYLKKART